MNKNYSYNIHNIITVESEGELPELEPFLTNKELVNPTIRVRIGTPRPQKMGGEHGGRYLHYRETFGHIGFEVGIEMAGDQVYVVASRPLRRSPAQTAR